MWHVCSASVKFLLVSEGFLNYRNRTNEWQAIKGLQRNIILDDMHGCCVVSKPAAFSGMQIAHAGVSTTNVVDCVQQVVECLPPANFAAFLVYSCCKKCVVL